MAFAYVEVMSWEPRVSVYHNFLTKDECEHIIQLGKPHMQRSTIRDSVTNYEYYHSMRTSSGADLLRGHDSIIKNIENKIAALTSIPVDNGRGVRIIHYEVGQKFDLHADYFQNDSITWNGGQILATLLMYLSDVEEGGETVFPHAKGKIDGLSIKPKMGDAMLFWSMKPDGTPDPLSWHGASPVIKGDKWCCTKTLYKLEYQEAQQDDQRDQVRHVFEQKSTPGGVPPFKPPPSPFATQRDYHQPFTPVFDGGPGGVISRAPSFPTMSMDGGGASSFGVPSFGSAPRSSGAFS